jgi:hypothetical protein
VSENYYVLLGLDAEVDDWPVIEAALEARRREWGKLRSDGQPSDRRRAERWTKLIPEIAATLRDATKRRAIAEAARVERLAADAEALAKLDRLIAELPPAVEASVIAVLIRNCGKPVTEAVVKDRLAARGIRIESARAARQANAPRPKLEETRAKEIRDLLQSLGKKDLYDVLGLGSRSSPQTLFEAADVLYKEVHRTGLIDPSSTSRKELAGYAAAIFKDPAQKERYDNTIAAEAMQHLNPLIETLAHDRQLDRPRIDRIVRAALGQGVSTEIALDYIEDLASQRKWVVQRADDLPSLALKQCGFCNYLAQTLDDERCRKCGEPLIQPCPRCSHPTPTGDACCAKCGAATGDAPLVHSLFKEAEQHKSLGQFVTARASLERALRCWPGWIRALEALKGLDDVEHRRAAALELVERLAAERKLERARAEMERVTQEFGDAGLVDLRERITVGLRRAEAAYSAGEARRSAGAPAEAVDHYLEAVGFCADHYDALRVLAQSPPAAPAALRVTMVGTSNRLVWGAVASRGPISYAVRRKAGGAPTGPDDGQPVAQVQNTTCDDADVPAGTPWYYAVHAIRGGIASHGAAVSGPHQRLAEASAVVAEASDRQVSLRWTRPAGAIAVDLWRALGQPPASPGQGVAVAVSGDSAVDVGLTNGSKYGYLIVVSFADPGGGRTPIRTPGIVISATPMAPPPAVLDLRATRHERTVLLEWTPPTSGEVQIRQTTQPPASLPGQVVSVSGSDRLGDAIPMVARGRAQVTVGSGGRVFFVPLTIVANTAVVGRPTSVTLLDDVTELASQRSGQSIILTWAWPDQAEQALVVWDYDAYVTSPDGAGAGRRLVSRREFDVAKLFELRQAPARRHCFTVFVRDPIAEIHSTGRSVLESSGVECRVAYKVVTRRRLIFRSSSEAWVELRADADLARLPAVRAVLKEGSPPLRPDDGQEIAVCREVELVKGVGRIVLPAAHGGGFVKLFFVDGADAREIRLMPAVRDELRLG